MKIPKKLLLGIALLLCAGTFTRALAAGIISYSLQGGTPGIMYPADLAGAPGVRTNNWNNITSYFSVTLADGVSTFAIDATGNSVTNMSVTFNQGNGGDFTWVSGATTNDVTLYNGVGDSSGGLGWLYITNIPYATYDVYFYVRSGDDNSGRVGYFTNLNTGEQRWIKDTTSISPPANTGSGYVEALYTNTPASASVVPGGNYIHLVNETNSTLNLQFQATTAITGASTVPRLKIVGFQITEVVTLAATNITVGTIPSLHAYNPSPYSATVTAQLNDGTTAPVTSSPKIVYTSSNTNVFTVSTAGQIYPLTNGTANLITYYPNAYATNSVTVIGPTALNVSLASTNLLLGNGLSDVTQATLLATYADATNVDVNGYGSVSFSSSPAGIVSAGNNGVVTADALGTFSLTGMYDGVSVTSINIGKVASYVAPGSVAAFSVNISDSAASHQMKFHDLSGAPGARVAYWNNMVSSTGNVTNQVVLPVDYQGNALAGTLVQMMPNNPQAQAVYTLGTLTTNESVMFGCVFDQGMNNGTTFNSQIVVSNVPYASYDAYFYFDNDTGGTDRPGQVTIDGVTQYRINSASYPAQPDNNGNGYVQAVQPATITSSITSVPFGNYIKFTGLTDNVLNVNWGAVGQDVFGDANAITRLRLTGFQIVKSLSGLTATNVYLGTPVPSLLPGNPATYSLSVLADFNDGTKGGNITTLSGITYASSNPNIFGVDTNGVITPGLTVGSATLTVTYQTNTLNVSVTTIAPLSVRVLAKPDTLYLDGVNGAGTAQARAVATFAGFTNIDISAFGTTSFNDLSPAVATDSTTGLVTPVGYGTANLGVNYLGTSYASTGALAVVSIANAPILKNRYSFRDVPGSTSVADSVGGATGTIIAPLTGGSPIVLDGDRANFPANTDYSVAPYVQLPAGLISSRGDATIDMWVGVNQNDTWERFFDFGSSGKGTDAHNSGNGITSLFCTPFSGGNGNPQFNMTGTTGTSYVYGTTVFPLGTEQHLTLVYSYNQNVVKIYVNGALASSATPAAGATLQTLNDQDVWLGASLWNDPPLIGWIDEFRIYEGAFSDANAAASDSAGPNVGLVSTAPASVVATTSSGSLNLSWPSDHTGWRLEVQTNSLSSGLGTNWVTVPGSTSVDSVSVPVVTTNGAVFYRLVYP